MTRWQSRRTCGAVLFSCAALTVACGVLAQSAQPAADAAEAAELPSVSVFEPLIGEWAIDAAWDSGEPLKARGVYTWHLNNRHVRVQTFLPAADGGEVQRYDGYLTVHPGKRCLVSYTFGVDGGVGENRITRERDGTLLFGFEPWTPEEPSRLRQSIRFVSPDEFVWTVERQSDEGWQRLISAPWRRQAGAGTR